MINSIQHSPAAQLKQLHAEETPASETCLVTGASGSNGSELVGLFAARGLQVRAMVRSLERAEAIRLPVVELVEANFDDPSTLVNALSGVRRAFLLTPSSERAQVQQLAFVEAAKQSGVTHMVKLSQLHADSNSPVRFLRYHAEVEAAIRASGLAWTFLRPNLFMQGLLAFSSTIQAKSAFFAAAGEAKVSLVDVRDIAHVAFAALTEAGHESKTYDLTGPQSLSHAEIAQQLSDVVGRAIAFVDIPPGAMREALLGLGMPVWQADGLIEDYAHYRRGEAEAVASGVQDATGQAPRLFDRFARDYAALFS